MDEDKNKSGEQSPAPDKDRTGRGGTSERGERGRSPAPLKGRSPAPRSSRAALVWLLVFIGIFNGLINLLLAEALQEVSVVEEN